MLAASLAGLLGVASLPGRYLLNRLSERLSPQLLLAACYTAEAAGVGLLGWAASPLLVGAYVAVYGAAFGAISPLRASTMADQFGRRAFGAITAAAASRSRWPARWARSPPAPSTTAPARTPRRWR